MRSTQVPYWSGVFNSTARTSFASTMACSRRAHLRFSAHRRRAAAPPTRACARRAATPTRSTASASATRSCLTHDRSLGQGSGSPSVTPFPAQSPKDFGGNGQNTSEFRIAQPFLPLTLFWRKRPKCAIGRRDVARAPSSKNRASDLGAWDYVLAAGGLSAPAGREGHRLEENGRATFSSARQTAQRGTRRCRGPR